MPGAKAARLRLIALQLMAGSCLASLASNAHGQTQDSATSTSSSVSEVVVTANKREERLLDVAASVSAVQGAALQERELLQIEDLAGRVPGLSIQPSSNRANRIILRGLNAGGNGATVASVVDEAPISYSSGTGPGGINIANFDTYDLARIEVLRGPQGTLYGATAEGGLVKYVTNAPALTKTSGEVQGVVSGIDGGGVGHSERGFVNLPLSEGVAAIRLSGFYEDIPGYIDAPRRGEEDANDGWRAGGRAQLLWRPNAQWSFRLLGAWQEQHYSDDGLINVKGANANPSAPPPDQLEPVAPGAYVRNTVIPGSSRNFTQLYSFTAEWKPGFINVLAATSYGEVNSRFQVDATDSNAGPGTPYGLVLGQFVYMQPVDLRIGQTNNLSKFNQEVRVSSVPGLKLGAVGLDLQGGVYYTHEDTVFNQSYDVLQASSFLPITTPPGGAAALPASYEEVSVFGDAKLTFSRYFSVEGGLRQAFNWQDFRVSTSSGLITGFGDVVNPTAHSSEDKLTWSVAPQVKLGDVQVYARIATGYRPGGPKPPVPLPPAGYNPVYRSDTTTNYEVGFKGRALDGVLTFDVAGFYIDWKDIQISTLVASGTGVSFRVPDNAGDARSQGVEWTFTAEPVRGLTLSDAGSYVDAELTSDAPSLGARDGDPLPYVPRWSNTLDVDYRFPAGHDTVMTVGGGWSYIGNRRSNFSGDGFTLGLVQLPAYSTFDAHLTAERGRYRAELFARNLGNKYAVLDYTSNGGYALSGTAQILQPLTVGLKVSAKF